MFDKLWEPINIGKVEVKNRIALSPMVAHDVGANGEVTEGMLRYYEERAKGGAGLIITGTTLAYPMGRLIARNPSIISDDITFGWARWADALHFHGAKASIQLGHGGAQGPDMLPELVSASNIPRPGRRIPRALTIPEIEEIVEAFGNAARRAKNAGADMVEIHGANGYLIQQFCSPLSNKRDDIYGADRFLFYVQILRRMKEECGADFPIVTGITAYEPTPGGFTIQDGQTLAKRLVENGSDAIRLTVGTYAQIDYIIPPIYMYPDGMSYALEAAKQIKKAVSVPVIAGTMIGDDPARAERAVVEGYADIILQGRPLLADPDWVNKAHEGRVDEIRKCIGCNECVSRLFTGRICYCAVNPYHGWEYRFTNPPAPAPVKKRVVVVGGGPGGMSAALIAAQRGHDVTLIERNQELGGALIIGSKPAFKKQLKSLPEWYKVQLPKAGVKMELGREATADSILQLKPDAVILATGSKPLKPQIRGVDNAVTADDVLLGKVEVGKEVGVIGGGFISCEVALYLAQQGKEVTIIEMLDDILTDVNIINKTTLLRMLGEAKVKLVVGVCVEEVGKKEIVARDKLGRKTIIPVESAVLAVGRVPDRQLEQQLRGKVPYLRAIGDGVAARKVIDAVHEGFGAAMFL